MSNLKAERGSVISTILEVLKSGDKYGYEIIKEVEAKTGVVLKQPSLYSCLTRLENQGIITSYWTDSDIGGRRHYYKYVDLPSKNTLTDNNDDKEEPMDDSENFNYELDTISNPIKSNIEINNESKDELNNELITDSIIDTISLSNETLNNITNPIHSSQLSKQQSTEEPEEVLKQELKTNNIDSVVVLHQLIEKQTDSNIKLISFIKNTIKASKEQEKIIEENMNLAEDVKNINITEYKDILGDMLYEKAVPKQEINDYAQQAFNFDNNEIKVENDKKYLNNVLFKTASKISSTKQPISSRVIEHFTNIGDLKTSLSTKNIQVKEYAYINYQTTNKNKYINTNAYILFNILQLLLYSFIIAFSLKTAYFDKQVSIYFISNSAFILVISLFLYLLFTKGQSKYVKFNSFAQVALILIQSIISFFIAFYNNYILAINNLLILFIPFIFILLSFIISKKAEKF